MVVVIDLEEEEAKKAAAAAKPTSGQASSNGSNSKQQPTETKAGNGKPDKGSQGEPPSDKEDQSSKGSDVSGAEAPVPVDSKSSTAPPVSDVQDSKGLPTSKPESSKKAAEVAKDKSVGEGTKHKVESSKPKSSENKDKVKDQPPKVPNPIDTTRRKKGEDKQVTKEKESKPKSAEVSSTDDKNNSKSQKKEAKSTTVSDTKKKDSSDSKKKEASGFEGKKKEAKSSKVAATEANGSSESKKKEVKLPANEVDDSSMGKKKDVSATKVPASEKKSSSESKMEEASPIPKPSQPADPKPVDSGNQAKEVGEQELKSEASKAQPPSLKDTVSDTLAASAMNPGKTSKSDPKVNSEEKKQQKGEGDKPHQAGSIPSSSREERTRPPTYSSFTSSLKAPSLQSWVKKVRDQLKQNKLDESVYAHFSKCKTDEERIAILYSLPIVHEVLNVKECYQGKHEETAKSLRVQGNAAFQKKEFDAALKNYSDSILKAPSSGSPELALAFANRSAVLYHKQHYVLCLQDIRQAFRHKYPDHLQYKLYERRGKACYCLRLKEDAICAFQDAINVLDKAQLDDKKLATVKTELTKQLQKCSKLVPVDSIKSPQEFNHNHGPIPAIKDSRSPHIPCMGNSLNMKYSDSNGRGLYATRNIEVGEVLIIEKPYASVTLTDHNLTHCHHCCNRVFCPLPCGQCSGVVFCSEDCRQTAWESYHYAECKYHDLIQRSELGMGHLALRMVLKAGCKYLREYNKRVDEKPSDPLLVGCNEDGVYDSSDYHTVYNLVAHTKDRSSADLFRRALGSVFMLKCIENSGFFSKVEGDDNYDLNEEKVYIGGHILRHTQMLPCNAHEVSEFVYKTYSIQMSEPEEVGSAIYSTLSLINHSCDPSVVRHSYGNECVVRAIRNISKGEEIVDNYGVLYPVMGKQMRQEKLLSQYYFTCNCPACICNWPMYEKIWSKTPVLKCKKCKIGRVMIPPDNQTTRAICEDCREVLDITPDLLHLSKSEGFYQGCLDKVLKREEKNEGLPFLVDHLRLIDRLLLRPWRDYNDCQEAIKQCYSTMANCLVLEEPDSDDEELLESERRRRP